MVVLGSSDDDHALDVAVYLCWMLQLLRRAMAKPAIFQRKVFGKVQFLKQQIGDFFLESCVEEELDALGLQQRLDKGNVSGLLILDAVVDSADPKPSLDLVHCLPKAAPLDLQLNEPLLPRIGDFDKDIDGLDGDEDLALFDSPVLSIAVVGNPAFPLVLLPPEAHHQENDPAEDDVQNQWNLHTIWSLL
jgi:hypothetical protein